jgi:hypothetical protein
MDYDYEKLVLKRAGQLERDKDRDLMLFARDDFSVLFYCFYGIKLKINS